MSLKKGIKMIFGLMLLFSNKKFNICNDTNLKETTLVSNIEL